MKESRIAVRYAKALFELSLEQNNLEQTNQDMLLVSSVCKQNKDFRYMLSSPIIKTDKKQKIIKSIFGEKINTLSLAFLNIISLKRREILIDQIATQFLALYHDYKGILPVHLTTASDSDEEIRSVVKQIVNKFTQKEILLMEEIKKDILGGFILRFGQYQYDDSIRNKIMKLKREFNVNIYEKGF
ncbi:MAG TPA: ATP synthase F1 subunit delta [Bacteroidales bacterium]|nr:ATP synthase F1 subunit delta [Bacteroidales bacterium]